MAALELILNLDKARRDVELYRQTVDSATASTFRLGSAMDRLPNTFRTAGVGATRFRSILSQTFRSVGSLVRNFTRQIFSLKTLLAGLISGLVLRRLSGYADGWLNAQNRVRAFIDDADSASLAIDKLFKISRQTRNPFQDTSNLFSRLLVNQNETGAGTQELLNFTKVIGQSVRLSGSTPQESAGALRQLSQLLANRQIRAAGQELQSLREQAPFTFRVLLDGLGLTEGEFRDLAEQGKLTSIEIIRGVNAIADEVDGRFSRLAPTIGDSFVVLNDALQRTIGLMSQASGFGERFSNTILSIADTISDIGTIAANPSVPLSFTPLVGDFQNIPGTSSKRFSPNPLTNGNPFDEGSAKAFIDIVIALSKTKLIPAIGQAIGGMLTLQIGLVVRGITRFLPALFEIGGTVAEAFAKSLIDAIKRQSVFLEKILGESQSKGVDIDSFGAQLDAVGGALIGTGLEQLRESGTQVKDTFSEIAFFAEKIADNINKATLNQDAFKNSSTETAAEVAKSTEEQKKALDSIGREIGTVFGDTFKDIITGTDSVKDAFENLAKNIFDILFRELVTKNIAGFFGGIFSGLSGGGIGNALVPSAQGNAFMGGNVVPFARGGVIDRTAIFPLNGGDIGVAGEAGAEQKLPVTRLRGGKLGIDASGVSGGGGTNVYVTVVANNPDEFGASERQIRDSIRRAVDF